jgi:hypothetical protein
MEGGGSVGFFEAVKNLKDAVQILNLIIIDFIFQFFI